MIQSGLISHCPEIVQVLTKQVEIRLASRRWDKSWRRISALPGVKHRLGSALTFHSRIRL